MREDQKIEITDVANNTFSKKTSISVSARLQDRLDALYENLAAMLTDGELHYVKDEGYLFLALFQVASLEFYTNPDYRAAKQWLSEEGVRDSLAWGLAQRHHAHLTRLYEGTTDEATGGVLRTGFLESAIFCLLRFRATVELMTLAWWYATKQGLPTCRAIAKAWDEIGTDDFIDVITMFLAFNDYMEAENGGFFERATSASVGKADG